jgi:predicted ATP-grasp superfamily ATP-dependent carboligase
VPSPRFDPSGHIKKLIQIIQEHQIHYFVPAWEDVFLISKHLREFPSSCFVLASKYQTLHKLHHKSLFINLLESHNIKTPKTILIESLEDLKKVDLPKYALKACYSRASQSVYKVKQGEPIPDIDPSPTFPWIAQEWLEGKNFCTFSLCHKGKVHAHSTYPVDFLIEEKGKLNATVGSYCLTFSSVDHEKILLWVQNFVRKITYTGQIAFDFIETRNGDLYAIECNPRITSGVTLFSKKSNLAEAVFGKNSDLIKADPSIKKQITPGMLLYGWRSAISCKKLPLFFLRLLFFKDLVFQIKDPLPFFAQGFLWIKHLIDIKRFKKRLQGAFTHDLDFNG